MHSAKRQKTLTEYIGARLTPAEGGQVRERAEEAGLTKSEWCRQVVLEALETGPETRLLLAELMALRKIFLTLHKEAVEGGELSAQRVKTVVEDAEATKHAMADQRIHAFRKQGAAEASGGKGQPAA
ncbi:MAG: plasmid mobilization protein [Bryobacteraceae bacterium]